LTQNLPQSNKIGMVLPACGVDLMDGNERFAADEAAENMLN
jgi:hypothetical protein